MNPCFRVFCRAYQLVFRAALPLLPYREPIELTGLTSIPPLLAQKGIYYYTTYENHQITAVNMHRENLDGTQIARYPLITGEQIRWQNA